MTPSRSVPLALALATLAADAAPAQLLPFVKRVRPAVAADPAEPIEPAAADRKALAAAGLTADDPAGLLDYIRQRTLSDPDLSRIQAVIKRLGSDDFEDRLKAAAEAERFGPAAAGPLKAAQADPDYEIAYRAGECLRRTEKVPHAAVLAAAVRALAKSRPAGTAGVLVGYLTLADDPAVADEIRAALAATAVRDGTPDPALVAALADPAAVRRAAAAVALLEAGPAGGPGRAAAYYPRVRAAARAEADPEAKFRMVFALLTAAREKDAVPDLIGLLADPGLPRGRLWQAEDYLLQLAGKDAPKALLGRSRESLAAAAAAWKGWWDRTAGAADPGAFAYAPRTTGMTLLVQMSGQNGGGRVAQLGPDMKERWSIGGLAMATDAQFFPDGTLAVAEQNTSRVTTRDAHGRVLGTRLIGGGPNRPAGQPQQLQVLDNGNLLVVCRNMVAEYKKDQDDPVMLYVRPQSWDIAAARRLADGRTLVVVQNGADHGLFLDDKGKEAPDQKLKMGMPSYQAYVDAPAPGRVLITELNQVVEYDLKTDKAVWTKAVPQPLSVQRLPNGNTLIVDGSQANRLIEVAPGGEEVWSYQPPSSAAGMRVVRGFRR